MMAESFRWPTFASRYGNFNCSSTDSSCPEHGRPPEHETPTKWVAYWFYLVTGFNSAARRRRASAQFGGPMSAYRKFPIHLRMTGCGRGHYA